MKPKKAVHRANCTHVNMDRVQSKDRYCHVCGKSPAIGFIYVCRQDVFDPTLGARTFRPEEEEEAMPVEEDRLRRELKQIGLSESVIKTAANGGYTASQLDKLKAQKLKLKEAIRNSEAELHSPNESKLKKMLSKRSGPPPHDGASQSSPTPARNLARTSSSAQQPATTPIQPFCAFTACHACRPYYKDRVFTSFDAVLADELRPVSVWDALPVKSAETMKRIGLREASPRANLHADGGGEVAVHGGLALTEEAVETHTPDIITAV